MSLEIAITYFGKEDTLLPGFDSLNSDCELKFIKDHDTKNWHYVFVPSSNELLFIITVFIEN